MEDLFSEVVIQVFVDLYKKGCFYWGLCMINWDFEVFMVFFNEEVIYEDENFCFYYVCYQIEDLDEFIIIVIQCLEMIMVDIGLVVYFDDECYKYLYGKWVIVFLVNCLILIIMDIYVDLEFGIGVLKVMFVYDFNDYELGEKYGLEVIDIINLDGMLNELVQFCVGQDCFEVRKNIGKLFKEVGVLVEIEDYCICVGCLECINVVVELKFILQWFLKMDEFVVMVFEVVCFGEVNFYLENMWNMYNFWLKLENVCDWCISCQLWWGQ